NAVGIKHRQIAGCDKPHAWSGPDMIDIFCEAPKRCFRFCSRALRRWFPLLARRIRTTTEVNSIPKLLVHPFTRMVKDADEAAAVLGAKSLRDRRELLLCRFHRGGIMQLHSCIVLLHVIHV